MVATPLALIVAITMAEVLTPSEVHLSPLLVAAPAITASYAGPRLTAVVGSITVIDQVLIGLHFHALGTDVIQGQLAALVVVSAFLVSFSFIRDRNRQQLVQVRLVSKATQQALLPPLPAGLGPLRLACMYLAAEQEAHIGGDLYAAVHAPSGSRILIGDVRGKGLPAISDAALLLGAFREAARRRAILLDVVTHLDESVRADLEERDWESPEAWESFITAVVLEIPDDKPVVHVINCGHPPPLLIRDHHVTALQVSQPAPPLGLGELCEPAYHVETFDFRAGETLLLYTDGIARARCPSGVFYPLAERVTTCPGEDPDALVTHVHDDLLAHVGGHLGDDAAMVAIHRLPD